MLTDYDFWFTQPSSILNNFDQAFGILFAALFLAGISLWIINRFVKHEVVKKLIRKFILKDAIVGLSGIIWYGLRYENIPIFGRRFWAGLNILILLVWLVFIFKYLVFKFFAEKRELDDYLLRSKYLPESKKR